MGAVPLMSETIVISIYAARSFIYANRSSIYAARSSM